MFERYTEVARRVIFIARYEASGSPYIETHHILLGLFREASGIFTPFLDTLEIESIRKELATRFPTKEKVSTTVDLPLSHESKRVLAYGAEEAERARHSHIGPAHIALGLLREHECTAAEILRRFGITDERMRANLVQNARQEHGTVLRHESDVLGMALSRLPRERRDAAARVLSALAQEEVTITVNTKYESYTLTFTDNAGFQEHGPGD